MSKAELDIFLAQEREKRKTDRERELDHRIQQIVIKHRDAMVAECEPLYAELAKIEGSKPPMPIIMDGTVYEYVGPVGKPK